MDGPETPAEEGGPADGRVWVGVLITTEPGYGREVGEVQTSPDSSFQGVSDRENNGTIVNGTFGEGTEVEGLPGSFDGQGAP